MRPGDRLFKAVTWLSAASIIAITIWIAWQLFVFSAPSRHKFGWHFLVTKTWNPVSGQFGGLPFIYGTIITSVFALVIAIPLGVGAAIFLVEMAPRKASGFLAFLIELLAAVPSVIYGLLGIFLLIPILRSAVVPVLKHTLGFLPIFKGPFYGVSVFSAGIVLVIMIVPFIVSVTREVLLAVPREQREASLALGATHWETVWKVVLPISRRGVFGAGFLALARALGETMAVTMVIGNDPTIRASLFSPGYSIAAAIANEFTEAIGKLYIGALIELGLVLFGVTFVINGVARLLILSTGGDGHES
ncbi:MAG: phosphate ABC transporter permease subunit PstC [Phycisphaerae bacterium]